MTGILIYWFQTDNVSKVGEKKDQISQGPGFSWEGHKEHIKEEQ